MKFVEAYDRTSINLAKVIYFEDAGEDYTRVHFVDGSSLLSKADYESFKVITQAAEDSLVPPAPDTSVMEYGLEAIQSKLASMQKNQQFFAG